MDNMELSKALLDGDKIEITLVDGSVIQTIFNQNRLGVDSVFLGPKFIETRVPYNSIESVRLLFRPAKIRRLEVDSVLTPDFDYSKLPNGIVICRSPDLVPDLVLTSMMWIKCESNGPKSHHFFQNMRYAERKHDKFASDMYIIAFPPGMTEFKIEE